MGHLDAEHCPNFVERHIKELLMLDPRPALLLPTAAPKRANDQVGCRQQGQDGATQRQLCIDVQSLVMRVATKNRQTTRGAHKA